MKKALVVLLALTAVAGLAFAQDAPVWTWGFAVNTGFEVKMGDSTSVPKPTIKLWETIDTTAAPTHARFTGAVAMGDFGAHFYLQFPSDTTILFLGAPSGIVVFSNWWVTANLFDKMVQINAGAMDNAFSGTKNKGYGGTSPAGVQVVVMPIDGLKVGVALPILESTITVPQSNILENQFKAIQVGAFYTMPDTATFALTYVNAKNVLGAAPLDKSGEFDFGVNVLAIPNLTAQLEGNLANLGDSALSKYVLFLNLAYKMDSLTPALAVTGTIPGDKAVVPGGQIIAINPSIDYVVMPGTAVGLSFTYQMNDTGATSSGITIDPYVKCTLDAKSYIKIDAAYGIADISKSGTWTLPIQVNFGWAY